MTGLDIAAPIADSVSRTLSAMRVAVLHGDAEGLRSSARSLRGHCGTFGARRMAVLCRKVEENARAGGDRTLPLIIGLEIEYANVRTALAAAVTAGARSLQP